jgi:hypothetical protein
VRRVVVIELTTGIGGGGEVGVVVIELTTGIGGGGEVGIIVIKLTTKTRRETRRAFVVVNFGSLRGRFFCLGILQEHRESVSVLLCISNFKHWTLGSIKT